MQASISISHPQTLEWHRPLETPSAAILHPVETHDKVRLMHQLLKIPVRIGRINHSIDVVPHIKHPSVNRW